MLRSLVLLVGTALAVLGVFVAGASGGSTATAAFPVTVIGSNGKVTVSKRPARIVSLSPTATETLFAIGAASQVVAVDDQSDFPKAAPQTSLSGFTPNVEAIAGYRPDLVVIAYDPKGLSGALGRLGITVLHQDGAKSFKGAYQQIRQLGLVTGREARAGTLIASMKKKIGTIVADARKGRQGLSVYHELDPTLYSATSKTFIGQVYSSLGLRNIADEADSLGLRLPAALVRVRRLGEPRSDRARRHGVLWPEAVHCRGSARVGPSQRGEDGVDRARPRLDRLALGAAARELLPGDVVGSSTAPPVAP